MRYRSLESENEKQNVSNDESSGRKSTKRVSRARAHVNAAKKIKFDELTDVLSENNNATIVKTKGAK